MFEILSKAIMYNLLNLNIDPPHKTPLVPHSFTSCQSKEVDKPNYQSVRQSGTVPQHNDCFMSIVNTIFTPWTSVPLQKIGLFWNSSLFKDHTSPVHFSQSHQNSPGHSPPQIFMKLISVPSRPICQTPHFDTPYRTRL